MNKKLIALLLSVALSLPVLASAAEYSSSISGNVQVGFAQAEQGSDSTASTAASTTYTNRGPGEDDVNLQWNHKYVKDDGQEVKGFVRFQGNGEIRYNVSTAVSQGVWSAAVKGEWERTSTSNVSSSRDSYVKLSHEGGFYFSYGYRGYLDIGNDVHDNNVVSWSGPGAGNELSDSRFNAWQLGFVPAGSGVDVSLLLEMNSDGKVLGGSLSTDAKLVQGTHILVKYGKDATKVNLTVASASAKINKADENATNTGAKASYSGLQLNASHDFGMAKAILDFTNKEVKTNAGAGATDQTVKTNGMTLGAVVNGKIVVSFGSKEVENADGSKDKESGRTQLTYKANLAGVAFNSAYGTKKVESEDSAGAKTGSRTDSYVSFRLNYGF